MIASAHSLSELEGRFWQAFLLAVFLHGAGWAAWHVLPHVDTLVVPVKALSIRLGENEGFIPEPVLESPSVTPLASSISNTADALPAMPNAKPQTISLKPIASKMVAKPNDNLNRRYVRKAQVAKGSIYGNSTESEAETLARYEQLISSWIQRYKLYPAEARALGAVGEGVVRVRINRNGQILYYAIERSTGNTELDQAMLAMVRQASPVPPVPERYPASTLVEFLIPVTYALESR